jgi:hypothetical protein
MATFQNAPQIHQVLGGFFQELADNETIGKKLLDSKLKLKFIYREPDANIFIDLTDTAIKLSYNDTEQKPDVEMAMKADTAHKFWQGNVNLVIALARREITAKGPIPKILKLLPIIKPAYTLYGPYLQRIGFTSS